MRYWVLLVTSLSYIAFAILDFYIEIKNHGGSNTDETETWVAFFIALAGGISFLILAVIGIWQRHKRR